MREYMERNFSAQIPTARKAHRRSAKVITENAVLRAFGGEPLAGSGFEDETPDAEFSGSDSNQL